MPLIRIVLILLGPAVTASNTGTVALPLDPGEWLSSGVAAWVSRGLGRDGVFGEIASLDIAPGDFRGMIRAAADRDLDRLLVVNCGYLGARVLVEFLLFDTADESLVGYWRGLVNHDALAVELPAGLALVLGHAVGNLAELEQPLQFLESGWEDHAEVFDR
jgi:hypothetical protein